MSLILNSEEDNFAFVTNSKGKRVGEISCVDKEGDDTVELEDGYKFVLAPRPVKELESGAGKSWFIREYAKRYKAMFPKNPIYLLSYLDKDETLDADKEIIRINAFREDFLIECMDSFVIFDDIDAVVN